MGVHDIETMNLIRKRLTDIDPNIFIYGEGWSAGQCALPTDQLAVKANMKKLPGIAAFCDDMRDALRGPFSDDHKGAFLAGLPGSAESIKAGLAGMKMPLRYVCEMVCDRVAASQIYLGDRYTDASPWEYYERSKTHYLLHPETRALLEELLKMVRDLGHDRTFEHMKYLLGCEKDY